MTHNERVGAVAASRAMPFRGQASALPVPNPAAQAVAALLAGLGAVGKCLDSPACKRSALIALAVWHLGTGTFNPFFNAFFVRMHVGIERIGLLFSGSHPEWFRK